MVFYIERIYMQLHEPTSHMCKYCFKAAWTKIVSLSNKYCVNIMYHNGYRWRGVDVKIQDSIMHCNYPTSKDLIKLLLCKLKFHKSAHT